MADIKERHLSLRYLDRFKIENKKQGLREPSGLALASCNNALWTVSDDTKKIFKLTLEGDIQKGESFKLSDKGLEGITVDPTGPYILSVKEETNELIKIQVETQEIVARQGLDKMEGYDAIASYFSGGQSNKGLEGITWNHSTGTLFVMKEGNPGLLIEVTADLKQIKRYHLLNEDNGFCDPTVGPDALDFSGLCYDQRRDCFWVISDQGQRWFLYDWNSNQVIQSATLNYERKGKERTIEKAEGVAIAPDTQRLYIVSDEEVRLYVFEICEGH